MAASSDLEGGGAIQCWGLPLRPGTALVCGNGQGRDPSTRATAFAVGPCPSTGSGSLDEGSRAQSRDSGSS